MRITTYKSYINQDHMSYLVKENATNYAPVSRLNNPANICEVMKEVFHLHELAEEEVYMICLNSKCVPTAFIMVSKGTVNASLVSAREVFIQALLASAVHIILCHNHPSGDVTPSGQDISLTKKIKEAGKIMDVKLLDHVIIGADKYFSFSYEGLLA